MHFRGRIMRRVQFAQGPWECFPDGHPPEKQTEEERRAYRCGLTLQQKHFNNSNLPQFHHPSFFDQSVNWFESAVQATSGWTQSAVNKDDAIPINDRNKVVSVTCSSPYASSTLQANWPNVEAISSGNEVHALPGYQSPIRHDSAASLEDFDGVGSTGKQVYERDAGVLESLGSAYVAGGRSNGAVFVDIPSENFCAPKGSKAHAHAMCIDVLGSDTGSGQVATAYPCNFCGMNVKKALAGMLVVFSVLLVFAIFRV